MPLDARREGKLTGSMVGAAIGVNPHCSKQKAYRLITGEEVFEGNEMTDWGNEHEKDAIAAYEIITGEIVDKSLDEQAFIEWEFIGITPDGFTDKYIEAKCPYSHNIPDEVPPHYMAQIQTGMQITGFGQAHLVYWTPERLVVFEVARSAEYWEQIFPLMVKFYECLKNGEPPKRSKKPKLIQPQSEVVIDEQL